MIRSALLLLYLCICLVPASARAERVRVQSGEHADFTRLVFIFRQPVAWRVEPDPLGHAVIFDRGSLEPDLSRLFDLIPRDRVAGVSFDRTSSTLRIETPCKCPIDVFDAGRGVVAMDIRDPDAAATAATEPPDPPLPEPPVRVTLPVPGVELAPTLRLAMAERENGSVSVQNPVPPNSPAGPGVPVVTGTDTPFDDSFAAARLRDRLAAEMARAASSGLLNVGAGGGKIGPVVPSDGGNALAADEDPIQSRVLLPFEGEAPPGGARSSAQCVAAEAVFSALASGEDPFSEIAQARAALFDDSGRQDAVATETLAKTYIGYGFGKEAIGLLDSFEAQTGDSLPESAGLIRAAAALIDDGNALETELEVLAPCGGQAGLWGLAAAEGRRLPAIPDEADVLASFAALSPELQLLLGEPIVATLFESDGADIGYAVRRALDLTREGVGLPALAERGVDPPNGGDRPADVVPVGGEFAEARTHLEGLQADLAAGQPIPPDRIELAQAFAEELRGTDLGADLLEAAASAHMAAGRPEAAFDLLDRMADVAGDAGFDARFAALVDRAVDLPEDAHFLGAVFGRSLLDQTDLLPPETVVRLADRLAALGFLPQAERAREALQRRTDPAPTLLPAVDPPELPAANASRETPEPLAPPQIRRLVLPEAGGGVEPDPATATLSRSLAASAGSDLSLPESVADGGERADRLSRLAALRERIAALLDAPLAEGGGINPVEPDNPATQLGMTGADGVSPAGVPSAVQGPLAQGASLLQISEESRALVEAILANGIQTPER